MKAVIHVVVTYHGTYGDEVELFTGWDDAAAFVIDYARGFWDTETLGPFPTSYDQLCEAWDDHDLWGSTDARWELVTREIEVPAAGPGVSP